MATHADACVGTEGRSITALTAEEEAVYQELHRAREQIRGALAALPVEQADWLDAKIGERSLSEIDMVHARLCRVFPYLSDVFTYLCYPWRVALPGHLLPDGKPDQYSEGGDAMGRHYGLDAHRRMDDRRRAAEAAGSSPTA